MEIPNLKTWKTALLLSIIVPVGLLTTFKLVGIFEEPSTIAETTTLPAKNWVFQRPYPDEDIDICYSFNSTYGDSEISFITIIEVRKFIPAPMTVVPPGDFLRFGLFVDVSTRADCCVRSAKIMFRNDTQPSYVWILDTYIKLTNLSLTYFRERYGIQEFDKSILELTSINNPNKVGFKATGEWLLNDVPPDAGNHQLEVVCEITYYNGTAYKEIIQPFQLTILAAKDNE